MATTRTDVIRLGIFDDLDHEVVVWPGRSDWGDTGWFLGVETNFPATMLEAGYRDTLQTNIFYPGEGGKVLALRDGEERVREARFKRRETA